MLSGPTGCGKTVYVQKFLKYIGRGSGRFTVKFYSVTFILKKLKREVKKKKVKKKIQTSVEEFPQE